METEIKAFEAKRDDHSSNLDSLNTKHADACRAEALGQSSNEREKIARDVAATLGRIAGTNTLIGEKQTEVRQIREQLAPLENELRKLDLAESGDLWSREIEQSFNEGRNEIKQMFALHKSQSDRVAQLRSKYENVPVDIKSAAYQAAEKLANARNGVRIFEAFAPEELKEMKAAKLIL